MSSSKKKDRSGSREENPQKLITNMRKLSVFGPIMSQRILNGKKRE